MATKKRRVRRKRSRSLGDAVRAHGAQVRGSKVRSFGLRASVHRVHGGTGYLSNVCVGGGARSGGARHGCGEGRGATPARAFAAALRDLAQRRG